ncbi:hypothetical protein AB4254_07930 [Vibrio breoganii]
MTYKEFLLSYLRARKVAPSVRLGEYFINAFVVGEGDQSLSDLREEESFARAESVIRRYINDANWDYDSLPVLSGTALL